MMDIFSGEIIGAEFSVYRNIIAFEGKSSIFSFSSEIIGHDSNEVIKTIPAFRLRTQKSQVLT